MSLVELVRNGPCLPPAAHLIRQAIWIGLNLGLFVYYRPWADTSGPDWSIWRALPSALADGSLYDFGAGAYVYSPVAAPILSAIPQIGLWGWIGLHAAVTLLLRKPALIALTFLSAGLWMDAFAGGTFAFVFVCGVLALRGHRAAALVYLALLLLMPRPIQLPLAVWIVAKMPSIRYPLAIMFTAHAVGVGVTGYAGEWIRAMADLGIPDQAFSVVHYVGPSWLPVSFLLAMALAARGRIGWASLVVSPYLWMSYLLVILWDHERRSSQPSPIKADGPASALKIHRQPGGHHDGVAARATRTLPGG